MLVIIIESSVWEVSPNEDKIKFFTENGILLATFESDKAHVEIPASSILEIRSEPEGYVLKKIEQL